MSRARGLFAAAAGVATLAIVCALFGANRDPARQGAASSTTTVHGAASRSVQTVPSPEVVMLAPRGALGPSQTQPSPSSDRLPLALQLQRELARVGCYDGALDGIWTTATRRALQAFLDRVNAVLPTDAPDHIQLSLVQAARERVCGVACPADESLAEGRCVSNVILARKKDPIAQGDAQRAGPGPGSAWTVSRSTATPMPPHSAETDSNAPGAAPAAAAPGTVRAAARRQRSEPGFLGLAIFKQFLKLGF